MLYIRTIYLSLCCEEATGVCGELYLYLHKRLGPQFIDCLLNEFTSTNETGHSINNLKYSTSSLKVLQEAKKLMEKYNQRLINEGIFSTVCLCQIVNLKECLFKKQ